MSQMNEMYIDLPLGSSRLQKDLFCVLRRKIHVDPRNKKRENMMEQQQLGITNINGCYQRSFIEDDPRPFGRNDTSGAFMMEHCDALSYSRGLL